MTYKPIPPGTNLNHRLNNGTLEWSTPDGQWKPVTDRDRTGKPRTTIPGHGKTLAARIVWHITHGQDPATPIRYRDHDPTNIHPDNLHLGPSNQARWTPSGLLTGLGPTRHGGTWAVRCDLGVKFIDDDKPSAVRCLVLFETKDESHKFWRRLPKSARGEKTVKLNNSSDGREGAS